MLVRKAGHQTRLSRAVRPEQIQRVANVEPKLERLVASCRYLEFKLVLHVYIIESAAFLIIISAR